MKTTLTLILLVIVSNLTFGQTVYRLVTEVSESSTFVDEFYIYDDSTCFLKMHYLDNEKYSLFKGRLEKTNDSLYAFTCKRIVFFGGNKRGGRKRFESTDRISFEIEQKDTLISSLRYKVTSNNGSTKTVRLKNGWSKARIKGASKGDFTINTKFIDPTTNEIIHMTVNKWSIPSLSYYGSKTDIGVFQISIVGEKLTIYRNNEYEFGIETETLLLQR